MSAYCPHGMVVGNCVFGCTVVCACGGWVKFRRGSTPMWWIARQDSRRRRSLSARIGRAVARLQRAVA